MSLVLKVAASLSVPHSLYWLNGVLPKFMEVLTPRTQNVTTLGDGPIGGDEGTVRP